MHVAVLGAGVAGVTSAYYLAAAGCRVTVIDRAAAAAAEASHANGGQLSYSFTDALARPSFLPGIPGLLLGRDPAIRVSLLSSPSLFAWGLRFLAQCTTARARANTIAVLDIALRSALLLRDLQAETGLDFAWRQGGKLVLLPPDSDPGVVRRSVQLKEEHGCRTRVLSMAEASRVEPSLAAFTQEYAGAVYAEGDAVGDAHAFTEGLRAWLQKHRDVDFRFGEAISSIECRNGQLAAVRTDSGSITPDAAVVSLGAWSPSILGTAGLHAAIYPVRGYSLTLPRGASAPAISITDVRKRLLLCPLGDRMRISGFADFVGFNASADAARLGRLRRMAEDLAPDAADYSVQESHPWAGSRPMTPDGRPLVGGTAVRGLFLNCGHGMLGWTLACATAADVAQAIVAAG